jgi:hypothetical protein
MVHISLFRPYSGTEVTTREQYLEDKLASKAELAEFLAKGTF